VEGFNSEIHYVNHGLTLEKQAINKLLRSVAQQESTINKLQQEILELKTIMENISG